MENLGIKIQHQHQETHNTWGGDIGRAALGGAITGIMAGAGVNGGEYLTNIAGNTLQSTLGTTLTNAVNKGISSAVISYTSTIGNTMSMATINGGSLRDILKSGRDTATSKDTLKNIAASGLSAGITAGLTDKLNLANPNTFTDKLKESAISNITSTAIQSTINGDSFTESLKHQAINTIVMAGANYTANKIGGAYHTGEINKATQLTLHAGLGALTNALTGNDALSGAIAGVSGEVFAELLGNSLYGTTSGSELNQYQQTVLKEYGGLAAGISSLITGKVQDLDVSDIRDNVYAGYRVGKNAAENNLVQKMSKDLEVSPFGKHTLVVLDPDNPEDFTEEKMVENGINTDKINFITLDNGKRVIVVSGQATSMKNGNLIADFNNEYDLKAINEYYNIGTENDKTKWYKIDYDVEAIIINSNLNDTDFIYNILNKAQNYKNNTETNIIYNDNLNKQTILIDNSIKYNLLPTNKSCGYNCNSFSNSLLDYSGAINKEDYNDMKGIDAGRDKKINYRYFMENGTNMNFINPLLNINR